MYVEEMSKFIVGRILEETEKNDAALRDRIDSSYIDEMKRVLTLWVGGADDGVFTWGIFVLQKPA